jgi:hypothetical protein
MQHARNTAALAAMLLLPAIAAAEVKMATPDAALIEHRFQIAATPEAAWQALVHPERYRPGPHLVRAAT